MTQLEWHVLPRNSLHTEPPFTLAVDDGSLEKARSVAVRSLVIPPLAFTELELAFDPLAANGGGATFAIDLPRGAAVSRFAVHDGRQFRDSELVDAAAAQGLSSPEPVLGAADSTRFSARVLQRAGQTPRLIIDYAERLANVSTPYRVRLNGAGPLTALRVSVDVGEAPGHRYQLERAKFTPDRDFSLSAEQIASSSGAIAWRAGKYLVARLPPAGRSSTDLTLLVDTSASQALDLGHVSERLVELSEALARRQPKLLLTLVAFDQDIHPLLVRSPVPLGSAQLAPLRALGHLGGTDLAFVDAALRAQALPREHLLLLSDMKNSIAPVSRTPGPHDPLPARWDLLASDAASEQKLRELRQQWASGHEPVSVVRFDGDAEQIAQQVLEPTPSPLRVSLRGTTWSQPDATSGDLTPEVGDAVWLFATLSPNAPLELDVAGKPFTGVREATDPALVTLLAQTVGQAHLDLLNAGFYPSDGKAPSVQEETVRVAREYGLVSPLSSLLARSSDGHPLGGRAVELRPLVGPPVLMTMGAAPAVKPPPEHCPDLIGYANQRLVDQSCPPLYVSLSSSEPRVIADVRFAGSQPSVQASPHLAQLADLLQLRPELSQVTVRASSKERAEGVIRYLVAHGAAKERLSAERLIDGTLPPRRATPGCKAPGEQVLLEVRGMSIAPLAPAIVKQAPLAEASPTSRLANIERLLASAGYQKGQGSLEQARQASERWVGEEPQNPVAYVALGDTLRAQRDISGAARAYGSLFDLDVPGAGLAVAASMRLQGLAPPPLGFGSREPREAQKQRWWDIGNATYRQQWQEHPERFEGMRALAYASLHAEQRSDAFGNLLEAAKYSSLTERIELPLFAHFYAAQARDAERMLELFMPRQCTFPSHADVLGATLSWEDVDSELEVNVTSVDGHYGYDSVLREHGAGGGLEWIPLPKDDASYPIRVSVRATRLSKNGYAFGALRKLDSPGTDRVRVEEYPFVVTRVGEPVVVLSEQILQRPQ